ncbi:MAG TPA: transcription termination factor Rho [Ilumatobacteraceae bacterium]|nr:transcription termination factor Rho [Ilumatobacteraceae bacterium]
MAAEALEQSMLESKDKEQLLAIAQALGIKTTARAAKATLIDKILETTSAGDGPGSGGSAPLTNGRVPKPPKESTSVVAPADVAASESAPSEPAAADSDTTSDTTASTKAAEPEVILGPDGEPLADWEIELIKSGEVAVTELAVSPAASSANGTSAPAKSNDGDEGDGEDGEGESRNSRRRRRRRNKGRGDGVQGGDQERFDRPDRQDRPDRPERQDDNPSQIGMEPVNVAGYLDLRDEGYGFLRVNGYLASRDDAYIPVKLTRQFGLRKGDYVTGLSRPAGRNEKNPAMLEIHSVNGLDPEKAKARPRFEDLTALFPDEKLNLEHVGDPNNMTARIIDLISPIGKGQRGIIVSPPKAGKTTIMKTIATSIEHNHPEVKLMVLLIDERPEEVTDMRRTVKGEVISSTFDRPSDEHTHVAELAIEKAKRLVEQGEDVVIILDGITRLSRAYNLAAPASGRILSGGIDAGALYPPKKFFGAARNVEEGGSLTILATALVETNSRMDDAIFEEFKGTGNMELRLDRKLSERRIYPAIDVDASSTRHEELLFDRKQLQMVWKLRRVLSGLAADGNAAPGLELLVDRLRTFRTNDEFLNEIGKQPAM